MAHVPTPRPRPRALVAPRSRARPGATHPRGVVASVFFSCACVVTKKLYDGRVGPGAPRDRGVDSLALLGLPGAGRPHSHRAGGRPVQRLSLRERRPRRRRRERRARDGRHRAASARSWKVAGGRDPRQPQRRPEPPLGDSPGLRRTRARAFSKAAHNAMRTTAMRTTAMRTTAMRTTAMRTTAMRTTAMRTTAMRTVARTIWMRRSRTRRRTLPRKA